MENKEYISVSKAADLLKTSTNNIYLKIYSGALLARKEGGRWRVDKESFMKMYNKNTNRVKKDLITRFFNKENLSKKDILNQYPEYFSGLGRYQKKEKVTTLIGSVRKHFLDNNVPFGNISGSRDETIGEWKHGIPKTTTQALFAMNSKYKSAKGGAINNSRFIFGAKKFNILPASLKREKLDFYHGVSRIFSKEKLLPLNFLKNENK